MWCAAIACIVGATNKQSNDLLRFISRQSKLMYIQRPCADWTAAVMGVRVIFQIVFLLNYHS